MVKTIKQAGLFAAALLSANFAFGQMPTKVISGNITASRTFYNDTIYDLDGFVYVKNNATLTIEAGTVVRGYITPSNLNTKGTLIITRNGMINAVGTECEPIVFTSGRPAGSRGTGDWGGIVILGEAPINRGTLVGSYYTDIIEGGLTGDVADRTFGGNNPTDNSGIMQYVRVEYAGIAFTPNNEINSMTMGGVGSGTTIDHIFVSYAGDDAFEWFGGTVNHTHLVAFATVDDNFDCDQGYNGKIQFAVIYQEASIADVSASEGWETDNWSSNPNVSPRTAPIFSNVTVVGPKATGTPNSLHQSVARIRRGAWTSIHNSVFVDHVNGVFIDGNDSYAGYTGGGLQLTGNIMAGMTSDFKASGTHTVTDLANLYDNASNNNSRFASTSSVMLPATYNVLTNPNMVPMAGSPALSGAGFSFTGASNFTPVSYRGAFGSEDWTAGWGEWDPQNVNYDYKAPTVNAVNFVSAPKTHNINFTTNGGDLFVLQTRESGATSWKTPKSWTNASITSQNFLADAFGVDNDVRIGARINGNWFYSCTQTFEAPCKPMTVNAIELVAPFCAGDSAQLKAIANGGYKSKTFLWNTGETTRFIYGQQGQTYSVDITDESGCTKTASVTVSTLTTSYSPTNFDVVRPNPVTFTGSWTPATLGSGVSLIGYRMAYRQVNVGAAWTTTALTTNTSATVNFTASGNPSANYEFTVFARVNDNGNIYNTEYACTDRIFYNGSGSKTDLSSTNLEGVSIYPNPTTSILNIKMNQDNSEVSLVDVNGRVVLSQVFSEATTAIFNVADLASGVYFVQIVSNGTIETMKIVKE